MSDPHPPGDSPENRPGDPTPPPPPGPPTGPPSYPGDTGGLPPYGTPPGAGGGWGAPPPPPPGGGWGAAPDNTPFDATQAIGYGWNKFRQDVGPWLLAVLVVIVVSVVLGVVTEIVTPAAEITSETDIGAALAGSFSLVSIVLNIVSTVVGWVLSAGLYRGALDVTEGRKFDFFGAFGRMDLPKVVLTSLLVSIGTVVGIMLCVLPGLLFMFFSYFAILVVVDRGVSPIDSIKESFTLVKNNAGQSLLLAVLNILVVIAGFLACCVGLFVAMPVVTLASAYAYKKFLGQGVAA